MSGKCLGQHETPTTSFQQLCALCGASVTVINYEPQPHQCEEQTK